MFRRSPKGEIAIIYEGKKVPLSEAVWEWFGKPYAENLTQAEYDRYPVYKSARNISS